MATLGSATEALKAFSRTLDLPRLVMYAGATWDWHRIHYDLEYAAKHRLVAPVVDGQMFGALFAEQVLDHFGPDARVRAMQLRFRSMVFVGETVGVIGEVVRREPADDGEVVTCDQVITAGARTCATGLTTVWVPLEASGRAGSAAPPDLRAGWMREVAIVGVAESDLGVTGKSRYQLQTQAIFAALDDAGVGLAEVDGLATNGLARFSVSSMAEYLGVRPVWTDSSFAGGASYEIFVGHARDAIASGRADVVVVSYGSDQKSARSRRPGGITDPADPEAQFEQPYGPLVPLSMYALAAHRHMHEFGTTPEQMAEVAVAAREWALLNPRAFRYGDGPLTIEDVLRSPVISSPLHALDCCLITDGGGAVVMTHLDRARDLPKPPIRVLGFGEASTNVSLTQLSDITFTGAADSGRQAFAEAGVSPADIDLVEVYDSFTITVLLTLEALGFCGRGEAGPFVADGRTRPGGGFPLNTSGGGLSYTHPGMFGIFLVIEAVRQLRGEAGARQVRGAELALAHGTGGVLSTHSTLVLGR